MSAPMVGEGGPAGDPKKPQAGAREAYTKGYSRDPSGDGDQTLLEFYTES